KAVAAEILGEALHPRAVEINGIDFELAQASRELAVKTDLVVTEFQHISENRDLSARAARLARAFVQERERRFERSRVGVVVIAKDFDPVAVKPDFRAAKERFERREA